MAWLHAQQSTVECTACHGTSAWMEISVLNFRFSICRVLHILQSFFLRNLQQVCRQIAAVWSVRRKLEKCLRAIVWTFASFRTDMAHVRDTLAWFYFCVCLRTDMWHVTVGGQLAWCWTMCSRTNMWQIREKLLHDFELGLVCKKHMAWNSLGTVVTSNPLHLGMVSTKSQTQLVLDSFAAFFAFYCSFESLRLFLCL